MKGSGQNRTAIGSTVTIRYGGKLQSKLKSVVHGFQSTMEDNLHFGLGTVQQIDTVEVQWPDGRMSLLTNVNTNQLVELNDRASISVPVKKSGPATIFEVCDAE